MELIGITQIIKFGAALVFVIALMVALGIVMKRIDGGRHAVMPLKQRRLKIIELTRIDARRSLVLIQRDNVQHLVILGPHGETVVESGIRDFDEKRHSPSNDDDKTKAA
jgi:flagellar protein FliO/FliZ